MSARLRIITSENETICARCAHSTVFRDALGVIEQVECRKLSMEIERKVYSCSSFRAAGQSVEDYQFTCLAAELIKFPDGLLVWERNRQTIREVSFDGGVKEMRDGKMVRLNPDGTVKRKTMTARRSRARTRKDAPPPPEILQ